MLKTFRIGGIHPPENKWSASQAIIPLSLPEQAIVPLSQHIGAPAEAVVQKGDSVKTGTLIAKAGGFVSSAIHSPVSGTVSQIGNALDASGVMRPRPHSDAEKNVYTHGKRNYRQDSRSRRRRIGRGYFSNARQAYATSRKSNRNVDNKCGGM